MNRLFRWIQVILTTGPWVPGSPLGSEVQVQELGRDGHFSSSLWWRKKHVKKTNTIQTVTELIFKQRVWTNWCIQAKENTLQDSTDVTLDWGAGAKLTSNSVHVTSLAADGSYDHGSNINSHWQTVRECLKKVLRHESSSEGLKCYQKHF